MTSFSLVKDIVYPGCGRALVVTSVLPKTFVIMFFAPMPLGVNDFILHTNLCFIKNIQQTLMTMEATRHWLPEILDSNLWPLLIATVQEHLLSLVPGAVAGAQSYLSLLSHHSFGGGGQVY